MSTSTAARRKSQIEHLTQQIGRDLATKTVLFHATLAAKLGLSGTELKCLDLIRNAETPVTATDLATRTGLTGGAITGVIDRLEREGFVERVRDPDDRRRWELHAIAERRQSVLDLFGHLRWSIAEFCDDFSDTDLTVVEQFLTRLGRALDEASEELRGS